jgi:predicted transcriptional regulator
LSEAVTYDIMRRMNKVVRKIEISPRLDATLERMAKESRRTPSEIVADAVRQLLAANKRLAIDLERWAEYERTGQSIDIEDARKRLKKKIGSRRRRTSVTA